MRASSVYLTALTLLAALQDVSANRVKPLNDALAPEPGQPPIPERALAVDDDQETFVDDAFDCKDDDCKYAFWKGCVPKKDAGDNVRCSHQYRLGDVLPSTSCRCAGVGILTAKYGSLEDAWDKLSEGVEEGISLEQFTDLMTNYNVPGYTAAHEFRKANTSRDNFISKEEFVVAAKDLMAATTGGDDKAMGSSSKRCCCPKKVDAPDDICLQQERGMLSPNMDAFTISLPTRNSPNLAYVHLPIYNSSVHLQHSGHNCHGSCHHKGGQEHRYIGKLHSGAGDGKASLFDSGAQAGDKKYVKFGDGLYLPSEEQTYSKCVHKHCSRRDSTYVEECGTEEHRRTCIRKTCSSSEHCTGHQTLRYCGHTKNTGLVRYEKVGTVGSCLLENMLQKRWLVSHKTCPDGHYHRTRNTGLFADSALQVCDCADECP